MKKILDWVIYEYEKLASTMNKAREIAKISKSKKIAIIAKKQYSGYGRNKREWYSPEGGLWTTLVIRQTIHVDDGYLVPYLISVAIAQTLEDTVKLKVNIKWPNDIHINGKKVAGILIETMTLQGEEFPTFFIGIGINVNNSMKEHKELRDIAISLIDLVKREISIEKIFSQLLKNINILLDKFITKKQENKVKLFELWKKYDETIGKRVMIVTKDGKKIIGFAKSVDYENGCLVLTTKDKIFEIVDCNKLRILEE